MSYWAEISKWGRHLQKYCKGCNSCKTPCGKEEGVREASLEEHLDNLIKAMGEDADYNEDLQWHFNEIEDWHTRWLTERGEYAVVLDSIIRDFEEVNLSEGMQILVNNLTEWRDRWLQERDK